MPAKRRLSGKKQELIKTLSLTAWLLISTTITGVAQSASPGSGTADQASDQYLVEFKGNSLPKDLSARIAALGGTIVDTFPEIKVALVAHMSDPAAATLASQPDVADVTLDEFVTSSDKLPKEAGEFSLNPVPSSASQPAAALYYPYQWDKRVIGADQAWQAGYLGRPDVRVAMIDTGIDPTHPELAGLVDGSRSISFCPRETPIVAQQFPGYPAWTDLYGHGTATAAIVSSNSNLIAGVTSRTSLMAIKAVGIVPCQSSSVLRGIYYAANHDADVINISLGTFPFSRAATRNYTHYVHLYVEYALRKGVSAVVVAAGNDSFDFNHSGNLAQAFCDVPEAICVSATGPTDSGPLFLGPFANIDAPAFYTNFGASAIDVAAPGGNISFDEQGNFLGISFVLTACATTDRQFDSTGNIVPGVCSSHGFTRAGNIGTSFAAPQVSGLAALLVSQLGHGKSAQVRAAIENSADDLGKPGVDPFYGKGRINVARALGLP
jgi:subtilisin family serine protease